ncbi:MAG: glycosyltransferase family 39 protein [Patescibacteria group bacterium]
MKTKTIIILGTILILASLLRLWDLGKVPISPDWDEAALGYNAYSLLHTGRDEYGKFLPIVLRSFDDYKPALYAYFSIPAVALFGLNTFAVRFPSALFGVIAVLGTFFLVKELFKRNDLALLSSFLLAISPWHIQFSRIAFESNVGLAFNIFSALFFLKGLKKPWFLLLSASLMAVNIYVYQSEKVFTPLLLLVLVLIYRKELFSLPKKYLIISVLALVLIAVPMISYTFTNTNALERAKGVSVFSQTSSLLEENSKKLLEDKKNHDYLGLVLDNRRIVFAKTVIQGYLSHYDLNWLFVKGDIARHHAPNMGLLYLFEFPFFFIGIYGLIFGKFDKKTKLFIFSWFLIAPIPASITSGVPHAVRTLNFLPTFQIFTAIGIIQILYSVRASYLRLKIYDLRKYLLILGLTSYVLFTVVNFVYYLNQYFVQQNYFNASEWQYGYAKVIPQIQKIEKNYKKITVSNRPPMDQSYMFFLFYLKYPPDLYQKESQNASGGFRENHTFGKFEFRPIDWGSERRDNKILYVGRPQDFGEEKKMIFDVSYPNGTAAMVINE